MTQAQEIFFCEIFYTEKGILHPTEIIGAYTTLEKAIAGAKVGYTDVPFQDPESTSDDGLPRFTGTLENGNKVVIAIIRRAIPPSSDPHPDLFLLKYNHEKHSPDLDDESDESAEYYPTWIGDLYTSVEEVNEAARKKLSELVQSENMGSYNEYYTDAGTLRMHATTKQGDEYDIIIREIPDDAW